MSDRMQDGSAWLAAQRRLHRASPIVYHRGDVEIPIPDATVLLISRESEDGDGATILIQSRDYLIPAETLLSLHPPLVGDRITGEGGREFVLAGEPCWRWVDAYRFTLRVHAREVRSAAL